jgi:hypothetical protein
MLQAKVCYPVFKTGIILLNIGNGSLEHRLQLECGLSSTEKNEKISSIIKTEPVNLKSSLHIKSETPKATIT